MCNRLDVLLKLLANNILYILCLNKNFHFMYSNKGVVRKNNGVFTFC